MKKKQLKIQTQAIHVGGEPDPSTGAIMPPIFQTSTYVQKSPGKHQGYEYTRSHNPTRSRLEQCLASLEQAQYSLVTSSGMAAITLILHALKHQSVILCGDDVYGGTNRLFSQVFQQTHQIHFVDTTHLGKLKAKIKETKPDVLWMESPTNPMLKISDIQKIAKECKKQKCLLVVDNTFMSPYLQRPLCLGADIVIHSLTKYLNGHSDVVGGAIMLNDKKLYERLWFLQNSIGPSLSPFDSWLVLRGLKTLGVRMKAHCANAINVANFLENHPRVTQVIYPGLKSHPQHALAKKQMDGFGGMISFYLKGGKKESLHFLKKLKIFSLAESLGGVESLIEHPAIMTHASVPKKQRELLGISDSFIRISVGIEDSEDLIADLSQALA